jgi:hypothetical protein
MERRLSVNLERPGTGLDHGHKGKTPGKRFWPGLPRDVAAMGNTRVPTPSLAHKVEQANQQETQEVSRIRLPKR